MYIDIDYIKERVKNSDLVAITSEQNRPNEIQSAKINSAIVDASAELDNALRQAGYVTPVGSPDAFVKRIVFDIALYYIYASKYDDQEMKDVYVRYNKAFQKINQIKSGELKLDLTKISTNKAVCMLTNKRMSDTVFTKRALR
jgi:phage gp36-like protein